jgi:hypothetical protein
MKRYNKHTASYLFCVLRRSGRKELLDKIDEFGFTDLDVVFLEDKKSNLASLTITCKKSGESFTRYRPNYTYKKPPYKFTTEEQNLLNLSPFV